MKIALVIGRYNADGGGAERWTDRHARFLIRQGFEVHLLSDAFHKPPQQAVLHPLARSRGPGWRLRWAAQVEAYVRRQHFDVVHDMGDSWAGDILMPHHGTRQGGLEQNLAMLSPWMRLFQRAAHRYLPRYREFLALERRQFDPSRPTRFIALSRFVADHMRRFFNVPADRIDVIPNGVDTDHFLPGDQPALRASWGWDDRTIFLLAAHNFALKGLRQAIEALGQLRRAGQAVGLIVLGQDRALPYIKQARRLGCASDVRFLGNRTDPVPYFQACDVYLQPTYYDPCSLVLLEALACGLPVVTTRQNGASELITAGVHGHIIDHPDDRHALARAMSDLVDPSVRRLAGHAARSLALRHTQERNSRSFIDIYRSLGPVRRAA